MTVETEIFIAFDFLSLARYCVHIRIRLLWTNSFR